MLRANSPDKSVEIVGVVRDDVSVGLPSEPELRLLVDALAGRNPHLLSRGRVDLSVAESPAAAARAVAVASNFHMMNRVMDATGVPIHRSLHSTARELGFDPDSR